MGGPACVKTILCGSGANAAVAIFNQKHGHGDALAAGTRLRGEIDGAIRIVELLVAEQRRVTFPQADTIIDVMDQIEDNLVSMNQHDGIEAMRGWADTLHTAVPRLYLEVTGEDPNYP